jgi:hypothetical protein
MIILGAGMVLVTIALAVRVYDFLAVDSCLDQGGAIENGACVGAGS